MVVGHRDRRLSKLVSTSTVPPSLLQGFNHQTGPFSVWLVELVFRLAHMFWKAGYFSRLAYSISL